MKKKDVISLLFEHAAKELEQYGEETGKCAAYYDAPGEEAEIKRNRFCALWDVIEEADLVEDYEKWRSQRP